MMRDKILLNNDYVYSSSRCTACFNNQHVSMNCPEIHFIPNIENLVKKIEFPVFQKRQFFLRKRQKKISSLANSKNYQVELITEESSIESSEGKYYNDFTEVNQKKLSIFTKKDENYKNKISIFKNNNDNLKLASKESIFQRFSYAGPERTLSFDLENEKKSCLKNKSPAKNENIKKNFSNFSNFPNTKNFTIESVEYKNNHNSRDSAYKSLNFLEKKSDHNTNSFLNNIFKPKKSLLKYIDFPNSTTFIKYEIMANSINIDKVEKFEKYFVKNNISKVIKRINVIKKKKNNTPTSKIKKFSYISEKYHLYSFSIPERISLNSREVKHSNFMKIVNQAIDNSEIIKKNNFISRKKSDHKKICFKIAKFILKLFENNKKKRANKKTLNKV